ncbi:MAG: hypothetical protein MJY66_09125 [Bacteroidaceae bacterium]|nr:hypothetical protein [Bacteroidaceae bacterium]
MRKYWLQNAVNVLGLALGFVCLSLSIIWIRYENSFDTFHKDADRMYTVSRYQPDLGREFHGIEILRIKWLELLKLPEIEDYTQFNDVQIGEGDVPVERQTDGAFFRFFDIEAATGTEEFKTDPTKIAVTGSCADRLFPGRSPIGEMLNGKTICAVLKSFPGNTSLEFDALSVTNNLDEDGHMILPANFRYSHNQFFKVRKGTDMTSFIWKAEETIRLSESDYYKLLPITQIHRLRTKDDMYVSYGHIRLFCLAGIVLFLCAMINFILFSIVRLDYRKREMALRLVNGSSAGRLYSMLFVEYGTVMFTAMCTGLVINILSAPVFSRISTIGLEQMNIIAESLVVMLPVFLIALAVCAVSVRAVRRHSMQNSINRNRGSVIRKACIGIQLFISVLFIFIVAVMARQFGLLRRHDWGMRINDTAVLTIYNPSHASREQVSMSWVSTYNPPEDESGQKQNIDRFRVQQDFRGYNVLGDEYLQQIDGQFGLTGRLKGLPYVTGFYTGFGDGLHIYTMARQEAINHDRMVNGRSFGESADNSFLTLDILNTDAVSFMDLTVIDGSLPDRPVLENELVITESLQKELGLGPVSSNPTITIEHIYGHSYQTFSIPVRITPDGSAEILSKSYTFQVIAVVKDVYTNVFNPTSIPMYAFCSKENRRVVPQNFSFSGYYTEPMITLTYQKGMAGRLKTDVAGIMSDTGLDYDLTFSEDRFYEGLKSQRHLRNMIMAVGGVCILIALFGIWSMIMLACQERRREIAVRKVHGARKRDILKIFGREYGGMLVVTSAFAFAVGYMIMHRWLQQYEQQTAISWWLYLLILAGMALVISLTVLHRVSRAAGENPSVVIKNE